MNFKSIIIAFIVAFLFIGCGKSQYELMLEKQQNSIKKFEKEQYTIWLKNGYTKEQAYPWVSSKVPYENLTDWLNLGIWQHSIVKSWYNNGFETYGVNNATNWIKEGFDTPITAKPWKDAGFIPLGAKKWYQLNINNPDLIIGINYNELLEELKRQGISLEEYKVWTKFDLIQPDDITYFKSKGFTTLNIVGKSAKDLLNNMSFEEFMKFMNINSLREQNKYLNHWKYTTNYKRFRNIVHNYYFVQ